MSYKLRVTSYKLICCLVLLVWGCGVKKESRGQRREVGSVEVLRGDSLWMERLEHLWATRKVEVRHIAFTQPDSAERQFVRSVTLVRSEEEARGEASSSLSAGTEAIVRAEVEAEASQEEVFEAETKKGALFRGVWVVVCVAGILLIRVLLIRVYRTHW